MRSTLPGRPPATPETLAAFLADQAKTGIKLATLRRRVAAIAYAHEAAGHEPPQNRLVKSTLQGIARTHGAAKQQKAPVTAERLRAMLRHCPNTLRGQRDRALLALGFAGAMRRSELVALTVADLEEVGEGLRVHVRRSKTDQEGVGQVIPVLNGSRFKVAERVKAWLEAAQITEGPVFRPLAKGGKVLPVALSTKSVAEIVKAYAKLAGLDPALFAGHSQAAATRRACSSSTGPNSVRPGVGWSATAGARPGAAPARQAAANRWTLKVPVGQSHR